MADAVHDVKEGEVNRDLQPESTSRRDISPARGIIDPIRVVFQYLNILWYLDMTMIVGYDCGI